MTTPTRLFICARNMGDLGTITTNLTEMSEFPLANMQRKSRARVTRLRINGSVVQYKFTFDRGLSERVNFIDFSRINWSSAATWEMYAYSSYDWTGSPLFVLPLVSCYDAASLGQLDFGLSVLGSSIFDAFLGQKRATYYFTQNVTAINSLIVNVYDTTHPDGYLETGRVYMGRGVELAYNAGSESMKWAESTDRKRSEGGTPNRDGSVPFRVIGVDLDVVTTSDRAEIADMTRVAGMREDCFISVYPGQGGELERDYTMVGGFTTLPDLASAFYQHWKTKAEWEES